MIDEKRIRILKEGGKLSGPIVYWMSRDQRVHDNWALLYAQEVTLREKSPLAVVFCLVPEFLGATVRQYGFMLKGLEKVEKELKRFKIPFFLLKGSPESEIVRFVKRSKVAALVADFSPLKINCRWKEAVAGKIKIPFYEVDAHNIVPCRVASNKQEYGAYTIRPKIKRLLPEFLTDFPKLKKHAFSWAGNVPAVNWLKARKSLKVDTTVKEVDWIKPGQNEALKSLRNFLNKRLHIFNDRRNDPNENAQSNLSPYLHFGQISAQRVALETQKYDRDIASQEAFLEELIVRRELSDNFCLYNNYYDSYEGIPDWAKVTLEAHRNDPKEYIYTPDQFEKALTHDRLWNAAQLETAHRGKMHGYMRMYWAKKILEWSPSPEEAFRIAIYLNDKYELDGRDPNGYAGIAWSIGGVHDRAWSERNIFGKIRYMSYSGCRRKFDVDRYIEKVRKLK
jgi:deoxyribodipyrimidine photo-lyase